MSDPASLNRIVQNLGLRLQNRLRGTDLDSDKPGTYLELGLDEETAQMIIENKKAQKVSKPASRLPNTQGKQEFPAAVISTAEIG